jgi:predicted component of type VI protein secretion system
VRRFRLRHQGSDIELTPGTFVVGRSSQCNLSLDDALVSRRHAQFTVDAETVHVEDLGSRNGININGIKAEGKVLLRNLDRVTVGGSDVVLLEILDRPAMSATLAGTTLRDAGGMRETMQLPAIPAGLAPPRDDEGTAAAVLLTGLADKALALGRFDEAERVLTRILEPMVEKARAGTLSPARLEDATKYALRLAEGTRRQSWIDWVFDVHGAAGVMISAPNIDRLHEIVRKVRYTSGTALRRYLERMRSRETELTAGDRFLLQRIEGIERVISA